MFTKQFQPSLLRAGLLVAVLCCGMATLGSALAAAEPVELIPRDVLFGNPDRLGVQLSPDGRYLSFVAPWEGVLNVWVASVDNPHEAVPVTHDQGQGITMHLWTHMEDRLLYVQDRDGDENWQVYSVDVTTGEIVNLTPFDGVQAQPVAVGPERPGEVLLMLNDRIPFLHDVYAVDLVTGERTLVYENNEGFVGFIANARNEIKYGFIMMPDGGALVLELHDEEWVPVDMIGADMDVSPTRYYLYDRHARRAEFLFTDNSRLENYTLAAMHPVVIPARDGLQLVSYLSLPPWLDATDEGVWVKESLPLVLVVHGGPWARDAWGYNPEHQWLANRGYAVLSVNFRGSTGFGKSFINAGNMEWGAKMQDDLLDAVDWAVEKGIADPDRVAIYGGSYGGYAVLMGLTQTPDVFAAGIDVVGPSSLVTLLESIPPFWESQIELFTTRVGDHRTEEGRAFLLERSPLTYVDQIRKPLLIA